MPQVKAGGAATVTICPGSELELLPPHAPGQSWSCHHLMPLSEPELPAQFSYALGWTQPVRSPVVQILSRAQDEFDTVLGNMNSVLGNMCIG